MLSVDPTNSFLLWGSLRLCQFLWKSIKNGNCAGRHQVKKCGVDTHGECA